MLPRPRACACHAALTHAPEALAPLCRSLFGAAIVPLATDVWHWAHSTAPAPSLLRERGADAERDPALVLGLADAATVAARLRMDLPTFLAPAHDALLLAGYQLRFLAQLPEAAPTVDVLVDHAKRQLELMTGRSPPVTDALAPVGELLPGGAAGELEALQERPSCRLVWEQRDLEAMQRVSAAGALARSNAVDVMLQRLATQRALQKHSRVAEHHARLRERLRQAEALEAVEAERDRAMRTARTAWLRDQLRSTEARAAQKKVRVVAGTSCFAHGRCEDYTTVVHSRAMDMLPRAAVCCSGLRVA